MENAPEPRTVVLVEGASDQRALEALAERRGRDLAAEGVSVVPIGGSKNIGRFLDHYAGRLIVIHR
jgi:predicted ATP-dependent endonuclease of OLD family